MAIVKKEIYHRKYKYGNVDRRLYRNGKKTFKKSGSYNKKTFKQVKKSLKTW